MHLAIIRLAIGFLAPEPTVPRADGNSQSPSQQRMSSFQTICKVDDVPEGESRMFAVGDQMIGVFHIGDEFFTLANACPHAGASLAHGLVEGDTVCCRIHHWRFCLRDGTYLDESKPEFNARTFATRVIGEEVQVEV